MAEKRAAEGWLKVGGAQSGRNLGVCFVLQQNIGGIFDAGSVSD